MTAILCSEVEDISIVRIMNRAHQFLGVRSTLVPQLLPQNCNHQEESLKKGGKARQMYIACTLCLERFLGVDNLVFWQEPSHASSSVQSPPLQSCPDVLLATQTIRSRPQVKNRVTGVVFQQWRALLLGAFGSPTERRTVELWAKQKQTGVICLFRLTIVFSRL